MAGPGTSQVTSAIGAKPGELEIFSIG